MERKTEKTKTNKKKLDAAAGKEEERFLTVFFPSLSFSSVGTVVPVKSINQKQAACEALFV